MANNRKTWKERILNAATKEDSINTSTLRRRFRIPATEMNAEYFHNSIMRAVRQLKTDKAMKRTGPGQYELTKKGYKMFTSNY